MEGTSITNQDFITELFQICPKNMRITRIIQPPKRILELVAEGRNYQQMANDYPSLDGQFPWSGDEGEIIKVSQFLEQPECAQAKRAANRTELILLMGPSGSGKTTLFNQFFGAIYEINGASKLKLKVTLNPNGAPERAVVGRRDLRSETLVPTVLKYQDKPYFLCDPAGLEDNRGDLSKIFGASATHMTINAAQSIKGIILVIDWRVILSARGNASIEVFESLAKILEGDIEQKLKMFVFAFTKMSSPDTGKAQIKDFFDQEVAHMKSRSKLSDNQQTTLRICEYIKANDHQIVVTDICNNERTVASLIAPLERSISSFSVNSINILQQDAAIIEFIKQLKNVIATFNHYYAHFTGLKERTQSNEARCREMRSGIEYEESRLNLWLQNIAERKATHQQHKQEAEKQDAHIRTLQSQTALLMLPSPADSKVPQSEKETREMYHYQTNYNANKDLSHNTKCVNRLNQDFLALVADEESCRIAQHDLAAAKQQALAVIDSLQELQRKDQTACAAFQRKVVDSLDTLQHVLKLLNCLNITGVMESNFARTLNTFVAENRTHQQSLSPQRLTN